MTVGAADRRASVLEDPRVVRAVATVLGLVAALPSLLWAVSGPDLLTDDYNHLFRFRDLGAMDAAWDWSFSHPARPLLGPYHVFVYGVIGDRPVVQAVLLATLGAAVTATLWLLARRWLPSEVALAAATFYAVVPNRASSRLWFPTGNYLLATLAVLIALHLLLARDRRVAPAVCLAAAVLLFEGVIGLALAAVLLWALIDPRTRARAAIAIFSPSIAAALFVYLLSPKRDGTGTTTQDSLDTVAQGLLGTGLWGQVIGPIGFAAFIALALAGLVSMFPSFAGLRDRTRSIRIGLLVTACSVAPFIVAGVIFAVRGIFDRANIVPLIGVAIVVGGSLELLEPRSRRVGLVAFLVLGGFLFTQNLADVEDYEEAAATGRTVLERIDADVPADVETVLVGPFIDEGTGIAPFVYATDLDAAVQLRLGDERNQVLMPWSAAQCLDLAAEHPDALFYDWRQRSFPSTADAFCGRGD